MAITEAFGGMEITFQSLNLYDKTVSIYSAPTEKLPTLFYLTEFRTGKTQISHTLCGEEGAF